MPANVIIFARPAAGPSLSPIPPVICGAKTPASSAPAGTIYTCPMHPQIRQVGPGSCPICGMALEPELSWPKPRQIPNSPT